MAPGLESPRDLFEGQSKSASVARLLRQETPSAIKEFVDVRPTQSGLTVVSLFDWYPMRGVTIGNRDAEKARTLLGRFNEQARQLTAVSWTTEKKADLMAALGFKVEKPRGGDGFLEREVQAAIIRDLRVGPSSRWAGDIASAVGLTGPVRYLTSELMWSGWAGKPNRADILCLDQHGGVVVVELKRGRQRDFDQVKAYERVLGEHWVSLGRFVEALTEDQLADKPKVRTLFVLAGADSEREDWENHVGSTNILFFKRTFTTWPGRAAVRGSNGG